MTKSDNFSTHPNRSSYFKIINSEAIIEFKQIILDDYNIELTDEEAYEDATALLRAFNLLSPNTLMIQKDLIDTQEEECD